MRGCLAFAIAVCMAPGVANAWPWPAAREGSAPVSLDDEPHVAANVVIDLAPAPGVPAWYASSFEQTITRELAGFERLGTRAKQEIAALAKCSDRSCKLHAYAEAGVDIVLFGTVSDDEIDYELYQTWTPARLETGEIDVGRKQSVVGLEHATRTAFHVVLKHGGLLDQKPYAFDPERAAQISTATSWSGLAFLLLLVAVALSAAPFIWAFVMAVSPLTIIRMRSARRSAAVLAVMALGILALDPGTLARELAKWPWLVAGLGGLGWGAFVVFVVRTVFPPLDGLERMPHGDLVRILKVWCLAALERLVMLAIPYTVLLVAIALLAARLGIPDLWTGLVIAPAAVWLAQLWFASWVECISARLDRRLVEGAPTSDNPWSREISDYLNGYVRRTGWDLDPDLLGRVVFLPGKHVGGGVVAYGGGPTHVRVVVDRELLVMAMGPLVEAKPDDEKPVLFPDWRLANVGPHSPRRLPAATASLHEFRKPKTSYPGMQRKPLGQPATLLGYVTPSPGQLVPLISDNPQDLAIVRQLLSEHYPWFAPDPDEEYDATDPTDKDLLFGALVHALGLARRNETQLLAIKRVLGKRVGRMTSQIRARLADAYAVLNFARHHLIQFLHYSWQKNEEMLTARARPPKLAAVSNQILHEVVTAKQPPPSALRARLVWLSQFFSDPIIDRRAVIIRRVVAGVAAAALVAGLGIAVKRSMDYHPIYVERMQAQERALQKGPVDGEAKAR